MFRFECESLSFASCLIVTSAKRVVLLIAAIDASPMFGFTSQLRSDGSLDWLAGSGRDRWVFPEGATMVSSSDIVAMVVVSGQEGGGELACPRFEFDPSVSARE